MTKLDDALERLGRALDRVGVPRWRPPADLAGLQALEAAIVPMRLPADLRELWRRIDATTLSVRPPLELVDPASALQSWRIARDEAPEAQPTTLLLIGSESLWCLSAELAVDGQPGGALFEWDIVHGDFHRRFDGVAGWLVHIAAQLENGRFELREERRGTRAHVTWHDEPDSLWPPLPPHPSHGATIGRDVLAWPESWQRAAGVRPEDLVPRGATHSIADLLASPDDVDFRGTIAGEVVSLASAGRSTQVRVDDGTATIDVHCPAESTLLGPWLRHRYEFDVVVEPGERHVPRKEPDGADLAESVEHLTAVLSARHFSPPAARAERIRRLF